MAIFPDEGQLSKSPRRRSSDVSSRKVRTRATVFMVIALTAGLAAAYLITNLLARRAVQEVRPPMVRVLVASADLPLATTLGPESVATLEWPATSVPPGALIDLKAVAERVTTAPMVKGELITEARLAPRGAGQGIAAVVPSSMRIMAVRVNDVSGLYGWLHPGDYVDVITTMTEPIERSTDTVVRSKIVLQNIAVKAVGKELVTQDARPHDVPVVMLLVTPEQSERLALAATHGEIQLTMRSGTDHDEVTTPGVSAVELLGPVAPSASPPAVLVAAAATPPPARAGKGKTKSSPVLVAAPVSAPSKHDGDVVEILRGDRLEERRMRAKESP